MTNDVRNVMLFFRSLTFNAFFFLKYEKYRHKDPIAGKIITIASSCLTRKTRDPRKPNNVHWKRPLSFFVMNQYQMNSVMAKNEGAWETVGEKYM